MTQFMGWIPPEKRDADTNKIVESVVGGMPPFLVVGSTESNDGKRVVLWDYAKKVNGGKHLPTFRQEVGDCFAAGTMVLGEVTKPIENVQIGDRVFTATGDITTVISTQKKLSEKRMVTVRGVGVLPITCTEDHRFLVYRIAKVGGKRVTVRSYAFAVDGSLRGNREQLIRAYEEREPKWVAAGDLQETDYLLSPVTLEDVTKPEWVPLPPYVAGYFAGNGYAGDKTFELTGPNTKPWLRDELAWMLSQAGFEVSSGGYIDRDAWRIRIHSVELVRWCRQNLYAEDGSKVMPIWAMTDTDFLRGLFDADGFRRGKTFTFDSTSPSLAYGIYLAKSMAGFCPTISMLSRSSGTYENAKPLYRVIWRADRQRERVWSDGNFVCRPISAIVKHDEQMEVYDIGVEDSHHSFLANGVAVHNCVSQGAANAVNYLACMEIIRLGEHEEFRPAFQPYIYGISRIQIGGGRINGDGSLGSWAADGVKRFGVLFTTDQDVPAYSGTIARKWGNRPGPPQSMIEQAKDNLVKATAQVTTYEQVRDAICNGYPVTVASNRGFQMRPKVDKGKHWGVPSGSWAHQMCFIGVDDDPSRPGTYCLNSWGEDAHGDPADDAPPGGFWVDADTVTQMVKQDDSFAFSQFDGFPRQELDWRVIG